MEENTNTVPHDHYDTLISELSALDDDDVFLTTVTNAWREPPASRYGVLFAYATTSRRRNWTGFNGPGTTTGCLTMIRDFWLEVGGDVSRMKAIAETPALTEEIGADERIPTTASGITKENLHVFAEWQRRLDQELGRARPEDAWPAARRGRRCGS